MGRRKDYLPDQDTLFGRWQKNFKNRVGADPVGYGVTPADAAQLQANSNAWGAAFDAHSTAQNEAEAAAETKDEARDTLEPFIRVLVRQIQANPAITDAQREQLGITVPDTIRTPLSENIVRDEPPPVIKATCTASKTVRIDWYPDQAPGQSEALPQGIDGVEIWAAQGGIPSDPGLWQYIGSDTNAPYVHNVNNAATVTMAYKARWFDRRKRTGPFCGPVTVAVTA